MPLNPIAGRHPDVAPSPAARSAQPARGCRLPGMSLRDPQASEVA